VLARLSSSSSGSKFASSAGKEARWKGGVSKSMSRELEISGSAAGPKG